MKNNLLPWALALLFPALATAQKPVLISLKSSNPVQNQADWICNDAGTIEIGQFIGQSIDTDLYQIFLCFGDSIEIKHQGDADLSGDPNPASPPGIGYVFYSCQPSISGPTLLDVASDPCILQGSVNGFYITQGIQNGGSTWFTNDGFLQNIFNTGQPLSLFFAPVTIDDYVSNSYESASIGMPPGPCVDANIEEAFEVVYLNEIATSGISNNFSDDCIGKFTISGGYAQFDASATYNIQISLVSDPTVKALVMPPMLNLFNQSAITFSVTTPGVYNVIVADGKSCGHQFQMNMSGCNSADNIRLDFDEVAGKPGDVVCVPLRVENFEILSGGFSVCWDSTLLKFTDIEQVHPAIANFFGPGEYELVTPADLRVIIFDAINASAIFIPDSEVLFELCFEVLDTIQDCTPIELCNTVSAVIFEDPLGMNLAVTGLTGGVCESVATSELNAWEISKIFPNPVRAGEPANLHLIASESTTGQLLLCNAQGRTVQTNEVELSAGENSVALQTAGLSPGVYFLTVMAEERQLVFYKIVVF